MTQAESVKDCKLSPLERACEEKVTRKNSTKRTCKRIPHFSIWFSTFFSISRQIRKAGACIKIDYYIRLISYNLGTLPLPYSRLNTGCKFFLSLKVLAYCILAKRERKTYFTGVCEGGEETRKIKKKIVLWGVHEVALQYVLAHAVFFSFSFARSESTLMRKYLQHGNHLNIYPVFYTDVIEGYIGVYSKLNNVRPVVSL